MSDYDNLAKRVAEEISVLQDNLDRMRRNWNFAQDELTKKDAEIAQIKLLLTRVTDVLRRRSFLVQGAQPTDEEIIDLLKELRKAAE